MTGLRASLWVSAGLAIALLSLASASSPDGSHLQFFPHGPCTRVLVVLHVPDLPAGHRALLVRWAHALPGSRVRLGRMKAVRRPLATFHLTYGLCPLI
jgi:hypothetical protein